MDHVLDEEDICSVGLFLSLSRKASQPKVTEHRKELTVNPNSGITLFLMLKLAFEVLQTNFVQNL
jgi:hypothetical protein